MIIYNSSLKQRARNLRKSMTPEEKILWGAIRYKQIKGLQFYRQRPIWQYIADFYCPAIRLVIEVDGTHHSLDSHQREYDTLRDHSLKSMGIEVLRFSNNQIRSDLDGVIAKIQEKLMPF